MSRVIVREVLPFRLLLIAEDSGARWLIVQCGCTDTTCQMVERSRVLFASKELLGQRAQTLPEAERDGYRELCSLVLGQGAGVPRRLHAAGISALLRYEEACAKNQVPSRVTLGDVAQFLAELAACTSSSQGPQLLIWTALAAIARIGLHPEATPRVMASTRLVLVETMRGLAAVMPTWMEPYLQQAMRVTQDLLDDLPGAASSSAPAKETRWDN